MPRKHRMGQKRKKLCRILSAFILCTALAAWVRILPPAPLYPAQKSETVPTLVYLDPGHGGFDNGAVGILPDGTRLPEKELTLSVAHTVAADLADSGMTVLLSREGDERLTYTTAADEVRARRAAADAAGAHLLVSIHANAYAGAGRAYGPRVYYNPESARSRAAAMAIADALTAALSPLCGRTCALVADPTYYVIADAAMPGVLIELGFLSDTAELSLLAEPSYQEKAAAAIAAGIQKNALLD